MTDETRGRLLCRDAGLHLSASGRIWLFLLLLVAMFWLAASLLPSQASCAAGYIITTNDGARESFIWTPTGPWTSPYYSYGYPPYSLGSPPVTVAFEGSFWALGDGDPDVGWGIDNGSSGAGDWLSFYSYAPYFYGGTILAQWTADGVDGCLASARSDCVCVLLADAVDSVGYFALVAARRDVAFNTSLTQPGTDPAGNASPIILAPLVKPFIAASALNPANGGNNPDVWVQAGAVSGLFQLDGCDCGPVGFKVYYQTVPVGSPPPTDRDLDSGWLPLAPLSPIGGTAEATVVCPADGWEREAYLATTLVFEDGYETPFVSPNSTRIACSCAAGCTDADADGVCAGDDCDDTNANCFSNCIDLDADGWCEETDCDDLEPTCGFDCQTDLDSDGLADCADPCLDDDSDGYGKPGGAGVCLGADCDDANANCTMDCTDLDGDQWCADLDCDDTDVTSFPGAPEIPDDGIDQDCNGADTVTCFIDGDLDGFGGTTQVQADDGDCTDPGESDVGTDCDDTVATCAADCLTDVDQDGIALCADSCVDVDSDGYGSPGGAGNSCLGTDCDDTVAPCAAVCPCAAIGDRVWEDLDGDGVQGAGEPGIPSVSVFLFDGSGALRDVTFTDANGWYHFQNLAGVGQYVVRFIPLPGYVLAPRDQGGSDLLDSDADPATGDTETLDLSTVDDVVRWDAGMVPAVPCSSPDELLYIYEIGTTTEGYPIVNWYDWNQPDQTTGYNIYRTSDPGLPHDQWLLFASDVVDGDEATPNNQWIDQSDDPSPLYYQVAAYNHHCPTQTAEGPW